MKIFIHSKESKNLNIRSPMGMVSLVLRFAKKSPIEVNKHTNETLNNIFKAEDRKNIIKGLTYLNKHHKDLVLVDVEDSNRDKVRIEI